MNQYLATVKITIGELEQSDHVIVEAANIEDAERNAYLALQRGDALEPSDSGFFDMGGEVHLEVLSVREVNPAHLATLESYLYGRPLTKPEGWHVNYEIDLDKGDADTPEEAAIVVAHIVIDQFMKLTGRSPNSSVTKPALTINGQLIDFEVQGGNDA